MFKVKCRVCGDIGYTAAPRHVVCKCGGRFKVIPESREERILSLDYSILRLFNFLQL